MHPQKESDTFYWRMRGFKFKMWAMRSARNTMMNLLARRDHSEKELRKKLKQKDFPTEEIEKAMTYAAENGWLKNPPDLSEKVADTLHRKLKGILFINNYLEQKGLPPVKANDELELEKARTIIKNKFPGGKLLAAHQQKVGRSLQTRGFTLDIIRKVIYEKH